MPLLSHRRVYAKQHEGLTGELEELGEHVGEYALKSARQILESMGPPWQHTQLSEREQAARADEYEDAERYQDSMAKLTDGQLAKATADIVAKRRKWLADGTWTPKKVLTPAPLALDPAGVTVDAPPAGADPAFDPLTVMGS